MEEYVSTIKYIEAGETGLESVSYALAMVEMFFSLKGEMVRQRHVAFSREAVVAAVSFIDSMTRQQSICPCYWLYFPIHIEMWRKKCQALLRKIKQMDDSVGSQDKVSVKLFGEEMAKRLSNPQNSAILQMHDLISDLKSSITQLNMVLTNPSDEAMCLLYEELVSYLEETDSLMYEADQEVAKQCSRCKNGRPQGVTVESWMERLCKEAEERGLAEYYGMLSSAETVEERKLTAMRCIYNDARDAERVLEPMMILERYNRYEALLDEVRKQTAKEEPTAKKRKEEHLPQVVSSLNDRLKEKVTEGYEPGVVDDVWHLLWENEPFRKKMHGENRNNVDGINLSVYAKVVGRLAYHGIVEDRKTELSKALFGSMGGCNEDTLRREISAGYLMELPSDEVIRDVVDHAARPLRG